MEKELKSGLQKIINDIIEVDMLLRFYPNSPEFERKQLVIENEKVYKNSELVYQHHLSKGLTETDAEIKRQNYLKINLKTKY